MGECTIKLPLSSLRSLVEFLAKGGTTSDEEVSFVLQVDKLGRALIRAKARISQFQLDKAKA